jgi:peptidoglycan/LPS O-acetylase OafA/YrhL
MATAIMTPSAPTRIAFLDSLRLMAALLVLTQHLFEKRDGVVKAWLIPMAPGVMGVAIFFFISGYVIPMVARNGLNVREFMIRRLFRIFPLYLVTLALMAAAGATGFLPKFGFIAEAPFAIWAANILLVAEYIGVRPFLGVSWTLAVELVWYAIFAASIVLFGKRAGDRLDIFVPVTLVALTILSLVVQVRIPLGRPIMIYAAVVGFQCFRYHAGEIDSRKLARSIAIFSATALCAMIVAFGVFAHPNLTVTQAVVPWIVATAVFLVCTLWSPLHTRPLLARGIVPALGGMSYSIYLLHPIAAATANAYFAKAYQVPVAIALTLAVSWLGFRGVERPFMRLGRSAVGVARVRKQLGRV